MHYFQFVDGSWELFRLKFTLLNYETSTISQEYITSLMVERTQETSKKHNVCFCKFCQNELTASVHSTWLTPVMTSRAESREWNVHFTGLDVAPNWMTLVKIWSCPPCFRASLDSSVKLLLYNSTEALTVASNVHVLCRWLYSSLNADFKSDGLAVVSGGKIGFWTLEPYDFDD